MCGAAYYTGFVYEAFEASGEGRALAEVERYDHLIKNYLTVGFAIGDMTLSDCLEANGLLPKYIISPDLFLLFAETERDLGHSYQLRKAGHSTSYSLKAAGFGTI